MQDRKILIVDDNPEIHKDFQKILTPSQTSSGQAEKLDKLDKLEEQLFGKTAKKDDSDDVVFALESAYQGQDALNMITAANDKGKPYAVVFMDVRMPPGWDGVETIRRIWEKYPYTEIVLCTAFSDYSVEEMIKILGVSHRLLLIKKPFDPMSIKQIALTLTEKWMVEDKIRRYSEELESAVKSRTEELQIAVRKLNESLRELQETQGKLLQSSKMCALGEMAGGIAHEINNPLAIISGSVEQLQRRLQADPINREEAKVALARIQKTVTRIANIVKGLLTFSRDGNHDPYQNVRAKSIVDDTLALCAEKFKMAGVRVDVAEVKEELFVDCRPTQISQVLLNLLNNAFDAVSAQVGEGKQPFIKIDVVEQGENIEVHVTDSGAGIPEVVREKLFQPFFTTKPVNKGTGLGLSVSRGFVQAHDGELFLVDKPGTEFVIRLPKKQGGPRV
jgi:two-component system NtrC family sensor kinase